MIQQEPTAGQRSSQIIGEGALYRLRFENNPVLPIVSVFAQAPTEAEAIALANAAPRALRTYIDEIQDRQDTPEDRRVVIRKLGDATGGVVNEGANVQIAAARLHRRLRRLVHAADPGPDDRPRLARSRRLRRRRPDARPGGGRSRARARDGFGYPGGEHERVR